MWKLIFVLLLFLSCKSTQPNIKTIEFTTSPCYGDCPVFNILINEERTAILTTNLYSSTKETFSSKLAEKDFDSITTLIRKANLLSLKNSYSVDETDQSSCSLKVSFSDGQTKEIVDYGQKGTNSLQNVYHFIFNLYENQKWK